MYRILIILFILSSAFFGNAQADSAFLIQDIKVVGNQRTSEDAIIILSELKINEWIRIPGAKTHKAIQKLWETGEFKSVEIIKNRVPNGVELIIEVEEYYLLGDIAYQGLTKAEVKKITSNALIAKRKFYKPQSLALIDSELTGLLETKGYIFSKISFDSVKTENNRVNFTVNVNKGTRYRVQEINFENNQDIKETKLIKSLEHIRPKKYIVVPGSIYENNAENELINIKNYCRNNGYPYASVAIKSIVPIDKFVLITYELSNMSRYRIDHFVWEGNTLFSDSALNKKVENIVGKQYSLEALNDKLYFDENYKDISSLYYEKGYASSSVSHQLVPKENGQMDIRVRIVEGKQMQYGTVNVTGNVRTKDNIILREVFTVPGDVFSRSAIIHSQQKLIQLDYFNAAKMDVKLTYDTLSGLVNVTYIVSEKISDQLLLSGGFDGYHLVGTLGFNFKNFSAKDVFKKGARWNPLPAGGGQHLSLKGQSDGRGYYGVSFSFYEPWLKNKPIGFSISSSYANIKDTIGHLNVYNADLSLSNKPFRNKFTYVNYGLNYKRYNAYNYNVFGETTGHFNAFSFQLGIYKNTTNNGFFPTEGNIVKGTAISSLPPFSRYSEEKALLLTTNEKFNWFEYYKLKFSFKNYQSLNKKQSWILASSFGTGYLGYFNKNIGTVPFQRFEMGGTGLTNYNITTNDFIGLRGYELGDISNVAGDPFAMKYSLEIRNKVFQLDKYMLSSHLFLEGGTTLSNLYEFDINNLKNSIGVGAKLYAPVIGVIGVDVGWGFNKDNFDWKIPVVQFTLGLDIGDF